MPWYIPLQLPDTPGLSPGLTYGSARQQISPVFKPRGVQSGISGWYAGRCRRDDSDSGRTVRSRAGSGTGLATITVEGDSRGR